MVSLFEKSTNIFFQDYSLKPAAHESYRLSRSYSCRLAQLIANHRVAGFYRVLSLVVKVYSEWSDTLPLILWFQDALYRPFNNKLFKVYVYKV